MLTKYGTDNITWMLFISVLLIILGFFLPKPWISSILWIAGILLAAFTLWFFRDPDRSIPPEALNNHSIILSPADGKVVEIKEINEEKFLHSKAIQLSIFLSPLDVHVNRSPVNGVVKLFKYFPGQYLVAYHPKSSELNEHSLIGVENDYGRILFKQIVGIVARRLVCEIKEGDTLRCGEKFGMMKFGSRMDVIVPLNTKIVVKLNQKVKAGETILMHLVKNS